MTQLSQKQLTVRALCENAIARVDEAVSRRERGYLSERDLSNIRDELAQMATALDVNDYVPSYPRFVSDSYPGGDDLADYLLEIAYLYRQRLK